jgi:hypothetical protein
MNIATKIRGAVAACAIGMTILGAGQVQAAPATQPAGWCPFGHVNPNDSNSACNGSDAAEWPESQGDSDGHPLLTCSRLNVNQNIKTYDAHGARRYWQCRRYTRFGGGDVYYLWTEIVPE